MDEKQFLSEIGIFLRKERIEQGYNSGNQFAEQNYITPSMYQNAESGNDMKLSSFFKIIKALGYNITLKK